MTAWYSTARAVWKSPTMSLSVIGSTRVDAKEGRLTADRVDLLDEPLKQLGGLGILGQDPAGSAQANCAHPLQLPPDADPVSRRRWR